MLWATLQRSTRMSSAAPPVAALRRRTRLPTTVGHIVREVAEAAGENPADFGSHSLRIGGARLSTFATCTTRHTTSVAGLEEAKRVLRTRGRWRDLSPAVSECRSGKRCQGGVRAVSGRCQLTLVSMCWGGVGLVSGSVKPY